MFRAPCAHHKEVKIVLYSLWYHHTYRCDDTKINILRCTVNKTSKHYLSVIQTSQLMLYREIIAVCSQPHTKHINTLCGQNVELLNVKLMVHIVTTGL